MKALHFEIKINAPKEKVWNTMLNHGTYEEWVSAAWPNTTYDGEWKIGSRIKFFVEDKSGTVAEIMDIKKHEYVLAKHVAVLLAGGMED